ncbi:hypothetical protein BKG93_04370 [Rodentibacter ratti]|uniref:Uncharacterized protein n=1 Tax=Rodentibacter ratti TaxID=1906745 RepID=A0A1V3L7N8_9PAST|nr:hypothetical protein [Rodentibacter ratti]OOF85610.1 hypothetical protein BKG93_04370 [Rodentibacter ratti]
MQFKFKKCEEPIFTDEPYYDLFDGGYLNPEELLDDAEQIKKVNEAIEIIKEYIKQAEELGVIEEG